MTLTSYQFADLFSCSRSSTATYDDAAGTLQDAAASTPRIAFDPTSLLQQGLQVEEQRTNLVTNPNAIGAAGGTPGTLPTNWTLPALASGLSQQVVGTGTANGRATIDLRISGTPTGAGPNYLYFAATTECPIAIAYGYTQSLSLTLQAGSMAGLANLALAINELASNGTTSEGFDFAAGGIVPTATRQTFTYTKASGWNAATVYGRPGLRFQWTAGTTVDMTLRISSPRLERGLFKSSVIRPAGTTIAAATRQADDIQVRSATIAACLNAAAFSAVLEAILPNPAPTGQDQGLLRFDDGTDGNKIVLVNVAGTADIHLQCVVGGTKILDLTLGTMTPGTAFRCCFAATAGSWAAAMNGGAPVTSAVAGFPATLTRILLGRASLNAGRFVEDAATMANGFIRAVMLAPSAVSSDQLVGTSAMTNTIAYLLTAGGAPLN